MIRCLTRHCWNCWHPLFAATVNYELATADGVQPDVANVIFMTLMAAVIAVSMKIVGVLLIIPAATARRLSASPEMMAAIAAIVGVLSVWLDLLGSLEWDTPAGPSIVVAALGCFALSVLPVPGMRPGLKSALKTGHRSSASAAQDRPHSSHH